MENHHADFIDGLDRTTELADERRKIFDIFAVNLFERILIVNLDAVLIF